MHYKDTVFYKIMLYGLEYLGRYYGNYRGFVLSNEDPLKMGRLQLRLPHLNPNVKDDETWAWPISSWGGKDYGIQLLPQKGDMVWVQFENGDADYPLWQHAGYSKEELPLEFKTPNHYGFKTPSGSLILINDNKDEEEIFIKHTNNDEWIKIIKEGLELQAKLIKLGNQGEEWAAMGETLLSKMNDIMGKLDETYKEIITHIHPTNVGPSGPPVTAAKFQAIKKQMNTIKEALPEFLSKKVKLDKENAT